MRQESYISFDKEQCSVKIQKISDATPQYHEQLKISMMQTFILLEGKKTQGPRQRGQRECALSYLQSMCVSRSEN
jgi:hypothetical protein